MTLTKFNLIAGVAETLAFLCVSFYLFSGELTDMHGGAVLLLFTVFYFVVNAILLGWVAVLFYLSRRNRHYAHQNIILCVLLVSKFIFELIETRIIDRLDRFIFNY